MKYLLLLMVLLVGTAGVVSAKKKVKKKKAVPALKSVMVHHTVCFGKCPEYSIELFYDGSIRYTGMRFVKDSGVYTKSVGSATAKPILNSLITNRADTCRNHYEARIPDLPGLYITLTYKDSVKKIFNAHEGPDYLADVSAQLDRLGKTHDKTWQKK